ncbi:GNAT family N-acetyltransferase [Hansschlegelia quercus]|uniref:N-acetyltransferase n=1 Tax=Hansschlegelia quercus TaxID=2528245 RepID=A0A4Q9GN99_9HYPH|nr:GNAT family protein [Hansschlegelia quercus]TBN53310.1 N-acetyltransferase [Hansschlegelia quercus]
MLNRRYPTLVDIGGLLADVPHDGYREALAASFDDPHMLTTLSDKAERGSADLFVARTRQHWRDEGFGLWFLRDMRDGSFAGWAGLRRRELSGGDAVEFAYALAPRLRCKGHAVRVGETVTELGFNNLGLEEIVALVPEGDAHAIPVVERLGFAHDGPTDGAGPRGIVYRRKAKASLAPVT